MERYNGWSNWETWLVNLWICNEEPSYHHALALVERAPDAYSLAEALSDWIRGDAPEIQGLYSDLLSRAMYSVDWDEIARHFWDDYRTGGDK